MRVSAQISSLAGILVIAALLLTGCPQPGAQPLAPTVAISTQPAPPLSSPTACETYTEIEKCPCGANYTLEAWEDVNANKMRDDSDRPLGGIVFQATWNQWEQRTVNTCTGYSGTSFSRGQKTAITDQTGKADLFVTSCHCDDPSVLDLQINVSQSPGYRLVIQEGWSFGFQSESAASLQRRP